MQLVVSTCILRHSYRNRSAQIQPTSAEVVIMAKVRKGAWTNRVGGQTAPVAGDLPEPGWLTPFLAGLPTALLWRQRFRAVAGVLCMSLLRISAQPASADTGHFYDDGYMLQEECKDTSGVHQMYCLGYIAGVTDAVTTFGTLKCKPNMMLGQPALIIRRYLESHPQCLHRPASELVLLALEDAFPCGKTR
jgi:Rap1a immunity proteins